MHKANRAAPVATSTLAISARTKAVPRSNLCRDIVFHELVSPDFARQSLSFRARKVRLFENKGPFSYDGRYLQEPVELPVVFMLKACAVIAQEPYSDDDPAGGKRRMSSTSRLDRWIQSLAECNAWRCTAIEIDRQLFLPIVTDLIRWQFGQIP